MFQTLTRGVLVTLPAHCSHAIKKPKGLKWEYQLGAGDAGLRLSFCLESLVRLA